MALAVLVDVLDKNEGFARASRRWAGMSGAALGHFPYYQRVAEEAALLHFDVCPQKWAAMSQPDRWSLNRSFLDRIIREQRVVWLATPPSDARPRSSYARELGYLFANGYLLSTDHCRLLPSA